MNTLNNPLALVTMQEVGARIKLRDSESVKKWCMANNVPVQRIGKKLNVVYQFELEIAVVRPLVMRLQKSSPQHWEIIFRDIVPCDAVYNYYLTIFNKPRNDRGFAVVKPMNKKEEALLKRLES